MKAKLIGIKELALPPGNLVDMLKMIDEGVISGKLAKDILPQMITLGMSAKDIVDTAGLRQISDDKLIAEAAVKVLKENSAAVEDFKSGRQQALGFLVGQLMKHTAGKASPALANKILREKLENG